jgi:hypothetical protein
MDFPILSCDGESPFCTVEVEGRNWQLKGPIIEMAGSMIICQPPFPLPAFTAAALFLSEFRAAAADE